MSMTMTMTMLIPVATPMQSRADGKGSCSHSA